VILRLGVSKNKIVISFIFSILIIFFIFLIYLCNTPKSIPRNIKILVSGNISPYHTLLELNENTFDVVVFLAIDNPRIEDGSFSIKGFEIFDEAMVDDFAESLSWWWFSTLLHHTERTNIIVERWSMELSQQQLNDVWRIMDRVVKKYNEPLRQNYVDFTCMRVIIDDEFYWGQFYWNEYFRSFNFRFTRADKRELGNFNTSDINLLELTHYLADMAPIKMGWEYNPHLIFRRPES
jgi:hypothetical protein